MSANAQPGSRGSAKVTKNFVTLASSEACGQMIMFLATVYLARTLGKDAFGIWAFAVSITLYLGFIIDAGTETWGTREVSTDHLRVPATFRAVIALRLRIAVVAIVMLLGFALVLPIDPVRRLLLCGGAVTLVANVLQAPWALRGLERMLPVALGTLVQRILFLIMVLALIRSPADAGGVTWWQGVADLVAAAIWLAALMPFLRSGKATATAPSWRATLREAWPFAVARVLRGAMFTLNIGLIPLFWSDAAAGDYGAAQRFSMPLLVLSSIFGMAVFPAIVRASSYGSEHEPAVIGASFRLLAALFVPISIGGMLLLPPIMKMIFGNAYSSAATPLILLLLALLMTVISDNARRLLHARHQQIVDLKLVAITAVLALAINLVAIPAGGAAGAGWAALISEILLVALVLASLASDGTTTIIFQAMVRPICAALVMAIAIVPIYDTYPFLAIFVGAGVYAAVLLVLNVRPMRDIRALEPQGL